QPASTRMFDVYARTATDLARDLFRLGNPMSWPAAWYFSWRTGAPASKYDDAVGPQILDGYAPAHKGAVPTSIRGEIAFATGCAEPFIVTGFGPAAKVGNARLRPLVAPRARFLVPLNIITGVSVQLTGTGKVDGRLRARWNGREIASGSVVADS